MENEIDLTWDTQRMGIKEFHSLCKSNIGQRIKHKKPGNHFIHDVSEMRTIEDLVLTGGNGNLQKEHEVANENPFHEKTGECNPMVLANHILEKMGFFIKIRNEREDGRCVIDSIEISVPKGSMANLVIADHLEDFITYV